MVRAALKSQSVMSRKKVVSVIGPNEKSCTREIYEFGIRLGKALIDAGYFIVCGGMGGLMEAVCRGARQSVNYQTGCTIGILPGMNRNEANEFCDIVIPSGLGIARNQLVVNSGDVIVAVGGGAGTLSEIAFAWQFGKPVICYAGLGGWSERLAGEKIDDTRSNKIMEAKNMEELLAKIKSL